MSGADLDFDPARLAPYLRARLPQLEGPMSVARIGGGQSNPTYRLRFAAGEVVLRKQPAGELLPSAHAVDREHRVMAALGRDRRAGAADAAPVRGPRGDRHAVLRDGGARRPRGPRFQHSRRDAGRARRDVRFDERRAGAAAPGRLAGGRARGLRPARRLLRPPGQPLDPPVARLQDPRDPRDRRGWSRGCRRTCRRARTRPRSSTATSASAT